MSPIENSHVHTHTHPEELCSPKHLSISESTLTRMCRLADLGVSLPSISVKFEGSWSVGKLACFGKFDQIFTCNLFFCRSWLGIINSHFDLPTDSPVLWHILIYLPTSLYEYAKSSFDHCFAPFHSLSPLPDPENMRTFRTLPLCNGHGVDNYQHNPLGIVVVNDYECK